MTNVVEKKVIYWMNPEEHGIMLNLMIRSLYYGA
jgi:hypothetical protein